MSTSNPPTEHHLTQQEDTQGYDDGLEPWDCICGESFGPGEIEAAFLHGFAAGQDSMDPSPIKSVTGISPRCDICGKAQQPEDDWNGETGNHRACEPDV